LLEVTNGYIAPVRAIVKPGTDRFGFVRGTHVATGAATTKEHDCMRHYDRADNRHLNDSDRYRDYDYLADDGWGPAPPEPLSAVHQPQATTAPSARVLPLESAPMWRLVLRALLSPRKSIRRALGFARRVATEASP
jgi:hypothetical protein